MRKWPTSLKLVPHDAEGGICDVEGGVLLRVGRRDDRHEMVAVTGVHLGGREGGREGRGGR